MNPKKEARMEVLRELNDEELTTRLGVMQAGLRIAVIVLILLGIGCAVLMAIPFVKYGLKDGFAYGSAYLALFVFVAAILAYPIYYLKSRQQDALDEIASRPTMEALNRILIKKRRRMMIVLISVIVICSIGFCTAIAIGVGDAYGKDDTVACSNCLREFRESSDNGKSISKTALCEHCYEELTGKER